MVDAKTELETREFVWRAIEIWSHRGKKGVTIANRLTKQNHAFAESLLQRGELQETLSPLLNHEAKEVRFAAAAYLHTMGGVASAASMLQAMASSKADLIDIMAAAVLRSAAKRA